MSRKMSEQWSSIKPGTRKILEHPGTRNKIKIQKNNNNKIKIKKSMKKSVCIYVSKKFHIRLKVRSSWDGGINGVGTSYMIHYYEPACIFYVYFTLFLAFHKLLGLLQILGILGLFLSCLANLIFLTY